MPPEMVDSVVLHTIGQLALWGLLLLNYNKSTAIFNLIHMYLRQHYLGQDIDWDSLRKSHFLFW